MTAIRSVRAAEGKFVQIANAALQDKRLSFRARGVLGFVISLPPDQHLTAAWLESQGTEGREAIRSALRELENHGYYRRTRKSIGRGRWEWDQVLSDAVIDGFTSDGNPSHETTWGNDAKPQVATSDGFPSDENPSDKDLKNEDLVKTEDINRSAREDTDPPVEATDSMTDMIIFEVEQRTKVKITRVHAELVALQIIGRASSAPRNPLAFVKVAIQREEEPRNFLPTYTPPKASDRMWDEAWERANNREAKMIADLQRKSFVNGGLETEDAAMLASLKRTQERNGGMVARQAGESTTNARARQAMEAGRNVQAAMDRQHLEDPARFGDLVGSMFGGSATTVLPGRVERSSYSNSPWEN